MARTDFFFVAKDGTFLFGVASASSRGTLDHQEDMPRPTLEEIRPEGTSPQ